LDCRAPVAGAAQDGGCRLRASASASDHLYRTRATPRRRPSKGSSVQDGHLRLLSSPSLGARVLPTALQLHLAQLGFTPPLRAGGRPVLAASPSHSLQS